MAYLGEPDMMLTSHWHESALAGCAGLALKQQVEIQLLLKPAR
jgi:hypothetical protein